MVILKPRGRQAPTDANYEVKITLIGWGVYCGGGMQAAARADTGLMG